MKMFKSFLPIILLCFNCMHSLADHKVYLVHGYGGSGIELNNLQRSIEKDGYTYENFTYNSFSVDIDSIGIILHDKIEKEGFDSISFVTYSLGALVVRSMYQHQRGNNYFPYIHRIVMIAPPNRGSSVADYYSQFKIFKAILGPNISRMTTDSIVGSNKYPIPDCEIGIIIGKVNERRLFSNRLEGADDGFVSEESSKLGADEDIRIVRASHLSLLFNRRVSSYVLDFLEYGKFL